MESDRRTHSHCIFSRRRDLRFDPRLPGSFQRRALRPNEGKRLLQRGNYFAKRTRRFIYRTMWRNRDVAHCFIVARPTGPTPWPFTQMSLMQEFYLQALLMPKPRHQDEMCTSPQQRFNEAVQKMKRARKGPSIFQNILGKNADPDGVMSSAPVVNTWSVMERFVNRLEKLSNYDQTDRTFFVRLRHALQYEEPSCGFAVSLRCWRWAHRVGDANSADMSHTVSVTIIGALLYDPKRFIRN